MKFRHGRIINEAESKHGELPTTAKHDNTTAIKNKAMQTGKTAGGIDSQLSMIFVCLFLKVFAGQMAMCASDIQQLTRDSGAPLASTSFSSLPVALHLQKNFS